MLQQSLLVLLIICCLPVSNCLDMTITGCGWNILTSVQLFSQVVSKAVRWELQMTIVSQSYGFLRV